MTSTTMKISASASSNMSAGFAGYAFLDFETRDYYEKVSKGLIEERSYDSWGPESAEEKAYWKQWWWASPILTSFDRIYWHSGFTGRGLKKRKRTNMERPGLIGPMGEKLEMDMAPQGQWQDPCTCEQENPKKRKRSLKKILSKFRIKY